MKPRNENNFLIEVTPEQLEEQYTWMWKHLMECISDEFTDQTIFEVIPEYHKRFEPSPPNNDKGEA
jgi:hypothetical protein